ncbi:hypothetical protein THAOC_19404, partial [Thalassiosira oceanica]
TGGYEPRESTDESHGDPPVDDGGANEITFAAQRNAPADEGDDMNIERPARQTDAATDATSAISSQGETDQPTFDPKGDECAGAKEELRLCLSSCDDKADHAQREATLGLEGAFNETLARLRASCDERVEQTRNETTRRLEAEFEEEYNKTLDKVQRLRADLGRKERAYKSLEERHHASRRELSETMADLRIMHERAMSKWVNHTLIVEDAWGFAGRKSSKIARPWKRRWERFHRSVIRPATADVRRKTAAARRDFDRFTLPRIARLRNRLERRWFQSPLRRPVELASKRGRALFLSVYDLPAVEEARTAVRLSVLSAIEEASKMGLSVLVDSPLEARREKLRRQKEGEQIRRDPHRSAITRPGKHATRPRVKNNDEINVDVRPTRLQLKFKSRFDYAITHSDEVYDAFVSLLPLLLVLFLG